MYSCEKELYEDGIQNSSRNLKVSQKPFKELLLLNDFNKAYQKVKTEKQRSSQFRTALEDQYNFTISDKEEVKIMEVDGKTFYNILIERTIFDATFFENLLIMIEKIEEEYIASAYIVKYIPDYYNETNIIDFTNGIENELDVLFSRVSSECNETCQFTKY